MIDKDWIENNLFNSRGLNNWVSHSDWWKNRGWLKEFTELMNSGYPGGIQQKLFHIYYGIQNPPFCTHCKVNLTTFEDFGQGYREYCSLQCATQSKERNEKISRHNDYLSIHTKMKTTNLEKYGVEYYYKSEEFKKQSLLTKLKRYGDPYFNNKKKNENTCLERYGVEHVWLMPSVQEKCMQTKLAKYGTFFPGCKEIHESKGEIELKNWLNSLGYKFQSNNTVLPNGMELDCYDPNCKFAFEYCGLYYHSTRFKSHSYHRNKMDLAAKVGIHLITIFEDEWHNRQVQMKDFIKAKLGHFDQRIYARKCKIIEGHNRKEAKAWFEANHIQSYSHIMQRWFFLIYNGDIVGGVSSSLHHRNNKDITLSRLAFKGGIQVIGGASKLISHFKNVMGPFVTWSDNRWTDGAIYERSGLKNDISYYADYSYVCNNDRIAKQAMQKKKIGCPVDVTEKDFCEQHGLYRIYDCGKKRWIYDPYTL